MTTTTNAYLEISQAFQDGWAANAAAIVGYVPEIRWFGQEEGSLPDGSKYWARHSVESVFEEQTSLATMVGKPGQKRYTQTGLVFVQLFCPKEAINVAQNGRLLAEVAKAVYRGKRVGCIYFRNVRIIPVDSEKQYYRFNVVAEYEHDEIA